MVQILKKEFEFYTNTNCCQQSEDIQVVMHEKINWPVKIRVPLHKIFVPCPKNILHRCNKLQQYERGTFGNEQERNQPDDMFTGSFHLPWYLFLAKIHSIGFYSIENVPHRLH